MITMENITINNDKFENDITSVNNNSMAVTAQDDNVSHSDVSAEQDDFDRLLDEFIRKSLDEDTDVGDAGGDDGDGGDYGGEYNDEDDCNIGGGDEDDDVYYGTGIVEFKYNSIDVELGGRVYKMPKRPCLCKASKLVLHNGDYDDFVFAGEPLVFVSNVCDSLRLQLVAHTISGYEKGCSPMVYLYSASESYPIEQMVMRYDEDDRQAVASCSDAVEKLSCGNYFFYVCGVDVEGLSASYESCNGGYCIPFVKVDGDMELPAVTLEAVGVKGGSRHSTLDVSLKFDKMLDKGYAYSLFLYNRNYNLVSRGATFPWDNYSKYKRKKLLAHLTTTYIPFGEYRLFVLQNGVPRWRVEFSVDCGNAVVTGVSDIKQFSEEFLLLSELEKESDWHHFREGCATLGMKDFFLSTYQRSFFNKKRIAIGLNSLGASHNFVYYGESSVAELGGLASMSRMFWNVSYFDPVDCIALTEATNVSTPNDRITEQFKGCNNKCIALYNISALGGNGAFVVKNMIDAINRYSSLCICLIGGRAEIRLLLESFPQLKRYFPESNCISGENILPEAFLDCVIKRLREADLRLSVNAQQLLIDTLLSAQGNGALLGIKLPELYDFVKNGIVDNFVSRVMSSVDKNSIADKAYLSTVEACDIDVEKILWNREDGFEESIRQLNMMVGLKNVKQNIITTFNRLKVCVERRRLGLKVKGGECHHMLFTGNPGTGKTTVAKMMGRIYRSLGLLSKGDVVFVDRSKIVGRYIGDTESNMQRILQEARGNILFVDEAYTLCDGAGDRKDFGHRAIECLLTVMAQEECDMIVIFAGYSKEIEMMMRSNQGLSGRFPYKFEFADYSADELMWIAEQKLLQEDYELTPEARNLLYKTIEETVRDKDWDFCNARWVGQYVDNGIIPAQCERLIKCSAPKSRDDYRLINADDVSAAYALHKPTKKNCKVYRGIGFTA